jgi:mannose-1-phosphate guanylyltransferase
MKKLTLVDFKGNVSRYNFYLEAHHILSEMENQQVATENEKLTLEKFMEMNPELVSGLQAAENEFREAHSKRESTKMNNNEYPNIPQAAIDAAYRLMDKVEASRRRQMAQNDHEAWSEHQELRDVSDIMDDVIKRAEATREILRQQNNENYTQSKYE